MTKIFNEDGDLFKMAAMVKRGRKIWVRDMAKVKINKMAEKAEVQFKKKKTSFACKSFRNTAKC